MNVNYGPANVGFSQKSDAVRILNGEKRETQNNGVDLMSPMD